LPPTLPLRGTGSKGGFTPQSPKGLIEIRNTPLQGGRGAKKAGG